MKLLIWIADHGFAIAMVAAFIAVALKFETRLPKLWKKRLFYADLILVLIAPLLGLLKDSLDSEWRVKLQNQNDLRDREIAAVREAARPRTVKEQLVSALNEIDPRILVARAAGQTNFHLELKPYQFAQIQKLSVESDSVKLMHLHVSGAHYGSNGLAQWIYLDLYPPVLDH